MVKKTDSEGIDLLALVSPSPKKKWCLIFNMVELLSNERHRRSERNHWMDSWLPLFKPKAFFGSKCLTDAHAKPIEEEPIEDLLDSSAPKHVIVDGPYLPFNINDKPRRLSPTFRVLCILMWNVDSRAVHSQDLDDDNSKIGSPWNLIPNGLFDENDLFLNPKAAPFVLPKRTPNQQVCIAIPAPGFDISAPSKVKHDKNRYLRQRPKFNPNSSSYVPNASVGSVNYSKKK
jgi:hypothetical protein